MAQPRISARDFLTGRDRAILQYDKPFKEALASDNNARVVSLCKSLTNEYHQQCKLFKSTWKNAINMDVASSITPFVNAILRFLKHLKSPMKKEEANMVLVSARFLRLCCAGREIYSKRCVESRDKGHAFTENLLGTALISLNKKRDEAIRVASKKKPPGKKKAGKKKPAPGPKNQNFFNTLLDSFDDVVKTLDELDEGHQEDAKEEEHESVEPFPVSREESGEDMNQAQIVEMFLESTVSEIRDDVYRIMQADHLFSIEDTIWNNDRTRNFVHLRSFQYIPLPTQLIADLIHVLPSNRLVLHNIGKSIVAAAEQFDGGIQHEGFKAVVLEHVTDVLKFLQSLSADALELVHAISFIYQRAETDMAREMRFLKMINKINPLFISFIGLDGGFYQNLVDFLNIASSAQMKLQFASTCAYFFAEYNQHKLTDIILGRVTFDQESFLTTVLETQAEPREYVRIDYTPSFMIVLDNRITKGQMMHLPIQVLNDDDVTVDIKIHDAQVDAYFKEVTHYNGGYCDIFIPSLHMACIDEPDDDRPIVQYKRVRSVNHADGEVETLQINQVV